jgi:hypothetical protein
VINENENEDNNNEEEVQQTDDDNDDDNEDDDDMPGLQARELYDSDSDDEDEDEDEDEDKDEDEDEDEDDDDDDDDDDEQSAGVQDDRTPGVVVEMVLDNKDTIPSLRTTGVPTQNSTTRSSQRVKQSHFDSDFVYTNYSSSLTMSQSHITRTIKNIHAMHSFVNYGNVMTPGINNVVSGLAMAQQYHVNKGLKVFGERGKEAVMKELRQLDELEVISPRNWSELTAEQRRTALPYLMFLTEKRDE